MSFFFFNDTATTEIYTLSLHDALPISAVDDDGQDAAGPQEDHVLGEGPAALLVDHRVAAVLDHQDRKSTRLNSSHANISYAVFCLKKKKQKSLRLNIYHFVIHINLNNF